MEAGANFVGDAERSSADYFTNAHADEISPDQILFMDAFPITGVEGITIQTTHEQVMDSIKEAEKLTEEEQKEVYRSVIRALMEAVLDRRAFDRIYEENGETWQDFCNDLLIGYTLRFKLFQKEIPICQMSVQQAEELYQKARARRP